VKEERIRSIRARKLKSNRSQALKMYNIGYTPLTVAVKLDISADEAEDYRIQYWKLKYMSDLEQMYKQNRGTLGTVMIIAQVMKIHNVSLDHLNQALLLITSGTMQQIQHEKQRLITEIRALRSEYERVYAGLRDINDELALRKIEIDNRNLENQRIEEGIKY
jgi:hypothetical protein